MKNRLLILSSHFLLCCLVYNVQAMDYEHSRMRNQLLLQNAQEGNLNEVRQLLENRADVLATDNEKQTALHLASSNGHLDVIKLLVNNDAEVNIRDINGRTPLQRAIEYGRCYCSKDEDERNAKRVISLELAQFLYEKGANIALVDQNGNTPLHIAVDSDNEAVVNFLLSKKADVNATNTKREGQSFLGEKGVIGVKLCQSNETSLHIAVRKKKESMVKILLDFNANPNAMNYFGTPLHIVANQSSEDGIRAEIIELLLQAKADPSIKNALQKTAYECAQEHRHPEIAKLLKEDQEEEEEARMARIENALEDITKKTIRPNQESNLVRSWLLGGSVTATAVIAGTAIAVWQVLKRR